MFNVVVGIVWQTALTATGIFIVLRDVRALAISVAPRARLGGDPQGHLVRQARGLPGRPASARDRRIALVEPATPRRARSPRRPEQRCAVDPAALRHGRSADGEHSRRSLAPAERAARRGQRRLLALSPARRSPRRTRRSSGATISIPRRTRSRSSAWAINAVFNPGAIKLDGRYLMVARVEGADRKSFFAVAESAERDRRMALLGLSGAPAADREPGRERLRHAAHARTRTAGSTACSAPSGRTRARRTTSPPPWRRRASRARATS